jgi:hypothetical protein
MRIKIDSLAVKVQDIVPIKLEQHIDSLLSGILSVTPKNLKMVAKTALGIPYIDEHIDVPTLPFAALKRMEKNKKIAMQLGRVDLCCT